MRLLRKASIKARSRLKERRTPASHNVGFYAEYLDTRTNQIIVYRQSKLIKCINATDANPLLTLDSESTHLYNPWEDPVQQTIVATLMAGETDFTGVSAKRKFFWYKRREMAT